MGHDIHCDGCGAVNEPVSKSYIRFAGELGKPDLIQMVHLCRACEDEMVYSIKETKK